MGPQLATINGLDLNSVNVTRDGLTTNDRDSASAAMSRQRSDSAWRRHRRDVADDH